MVRTTDALRVIATAVDGLGLPMWTECSITPTAIKLGFRTPADVDRWARHIGIPPAAVLHVEGSYAAVDFYTGDGGWCGAHAITLAAPIPQAVTT